MAPRSRDLVFLGALCARPADTFLSANVRGAIPQWLGARVEAAEASATSAVIDMSAAQELLECPLLKLSDHVMLDPNYTTFWGQAGSWRTLPDGWTTGSWGQRFFSQNWRKVSFRNFDGREALYAEELSDEELKTSYGWTVGAGLLNHPAIRQLQGDWDKAKIFSRLRESFEEGIPPKKLGRSDPTTKFALFDCADQLLFVIQLALPDDGPGAIQVYDRVGNLAIHSLTDFAVARHQFVDVHGNLLARAEAPGLGQNLSLSDYPENLAKGQVLSYELSFEEGGYEGASRVLEPKFRWILASAVQLRAIVDGRRALLPPLPGMLPRLYWATSLTLIGIVTFACLNQLLQKRGRRSKLAEPALSEEYL